MEKFKLGDRVTNVSTGEKSPQWRSYFVRRISRTRKNRYGINHTERLIQCTDGKGKFWETDPEVIFPGWLSPEECERLFKPIWEKRFGKKQEART